MARKLILHIGPPKTGTTALQHFLHGHRSTLFDNGLLYPFEDFNHRRLAHELGLGIVRPTGRTGQAKEWERLKTACHDFPAHDILLSAEAFFLAFLPGAVNEGAVERLGKALATLGRPVEVVFYFRRLDDWADAFYIEHLKHFLPFAPESFLQHISSLLGPEEWSRRWRALPAVERVIPRPYGFSSDFDIRQDFMTFLGWEPERLPMAATYSGNPNRRPHDTQLRWLYGYMQLFRQCYPDPPEGFNFPFGPMDRLVGEFLSATAAWPGTTDYRLMPTEAVSSLLQTSRAFAQDCLARDFGASELWTSWKPKENWLDLAVADLRAEGNAHPERLRPWQVLWQHTVRIMGPPASSAGSGTQSLLLPPFPTQPPTELPIDMHSEKLSSALSGFRNIVVSGPQRSGTTFMGFALGKLLQFEYYKEEAIENDNLDRLLELLAMDHPKIIQCPGLCHALDLIRREDTVVILMRRDLTEIQRSEQRIHWNQERKRQGVRMKEEEYEKFKYLTRVSTPSEGDEYPAIDFSAPIAVIKYAFWDQYQQPRIPHTVEVQYNDLPGYFPEWWVDASERTSFGPRQVERYSDGMYAKLYVDTGAGFNESESMEQVIRPGHNRISFDLSDLGTIHALRFDPLAIPASLTLLQIGMGETPSADSAIPPFTTNAIFSEGNTLYFATDDSNIYLSPKDLPGLPDIIFEYHVHATGMALIPSLLHRLAEESLTAEVPPVAQATEEVLETLRVELSGQQAARLAAESLVSELESANKALQTQLLEQTTAMESSAREHAGLLSRWQALHKTMEAKERQTAVLSAILAEKERTEEILVQRNRKFQTDIAGQQAQLAVLTAQVEQLVDAGQAIRQEQENWRSLLQSQTDRMLSLQTEKNRLEGMLRSSEQQRTALQANQTALQERLDQQQIQWKESERQFLSLETENNSLQDAKENLQTELDRLRQLIAQLESERWSILSQMDSPSDGTDKRSKSRRRKRRLSLVFRSQSGDATEQGLWKGLIALAVQHPKVFVRELNPGNAMTLLRAVRREPTSQILRNARNRLFGRPVQMIPAASAQGMLNGREGKAEADLSLVESRKVRFYIDQIQEFEYHLSLRGWLFSETNLIRALFLIQGADDNRPSPVLYQLERTDVFHHFNHRNAISSGFSDQLEKLSTGEVDLFLEIVFDDGARTRIGIGTATFSAPGLTQLDAHLLSNKSVFVSRLAQQQQEAHKTVGIYTNSKGNYFFHEIKRLLVAGMESIGYQALDLTELDGFAKAATFHIVIAPHEFFQLGAGVKLARKTPKGLILLNTEQPSSEWFKVCTEYFRQAVEIWDMNYYSWRRMQASLPTARYVPLSYLPDFPLFGEIPRLPENYCTCFLERHILENSYLHAPFEERPIDILFVGHASPRRQQFFARNAEFFARYNCYFHLTDLSLGPVLENPTSMNTATAIGLAQRSKIVLNIHHGSQTYFEWHRMVIHGMWQRALVISDLCSESPPFEPDRDFMQDSLDGLPDLLAFFLSHPDGPGEANRIIRSAHHKLTTQCDLRNILQKVMMSWQEYPEKIRSFRQKSVQE